jgi:hypothetical protein
MPINKNVLEEYKKDINIFIETGSLRGDTIYIALDLGFNKIYSIELSDKYYNFCVDRFKHQEKVTLLQGDSELILGSKIINQLTERALFWLDGHYSGYDTALGAHACPLIGELISIKSSVLNNHTIMIDDVRLMGNEWSDININTIIDLLYDINKDYSIEYRKGYQSNDIMIAYIKEN